MICIRTKAYSIIYKIDWIYGNPQRYDYKITGECTLYGKTTMQEMDLAFCKLIEQNIFPLPSDYFWDSENSSFQAYSKKKVEFTLIARDQ